MKKAAAFILALAVSAGAVLSAYAADAAIRYDFDGDLTDSVGSSDLTASGDITYADGVTGQSAYFTDSAYASLPSGVMSDVTDFTITAWVKPDTVSDWMRVFDFGTGTAKYMFLTLQNSSSQTVFAITTNNSGNEQKITADAAFTAGTWTHIAITKSGNTAIMYIDGVETGRNESMTVSPKDLGATNLNYIAKSQYSADPYYAGCIDDFRIYKTALTETEVQAIAGAANADAVSAEDVTVDISANSEVTLPDYVAAKFSDGSEKDVRVIWDDYDSGLSARDGSYTVNGTLMGTEITVTATINVTSQSITDGLTVMTEIYSDSGKAYADYTVDASGYTGDAIAAVAIYDGEGKLAGIGMSSFDKLETGSYSVSAELPDSEDITVNAFLLDKNMKPLIKTGFRDFGNPYGSRFDADEVQLSDGIFKTSQDTGLSFVKSLDVDRLLAPVAYSTGASTDTSKYYGGWEAYSYRSYKGNGISGHSLGHWLSAASDMYAVTGDAEIKEKLDYAVDKLAEYQEIDGTGYIGGVSKTKLVSTLTAGTVNASEFELNGYWVPWYSFHKIYQGLIDAYTLAGNETALTVVKGFADWAIDVTSNLTDEQFANMLNCEFGGMNEAMAELYDITGEKKYYDLAIRFSQESILEPLSEEKDELTGKHANTQIPKVIGAAALYEENDSLTGYKTAAEFFYDTVVNHRSYAIGGNSNYEHFEATTAETLGTETCETCNTYNMLKLTEHLYAWDHKAEYMDYYEKALFNHILASQDPDTGEKSYFMSTKQGHFKVYSDALSGNSFWCCVGSGMENPGRYTRDIYYKDGNDFYVNQFIASTVEWEEKGLTVSQTTNFPYEDTTVIKIEKGSADMSMKLRIPSWIASAATVTINDEELISVSETGYYTIDRVWNEGDTVTLTMPMALHTYTSRDDEHKAAFMYGPVVLAGDFGATPVDDTVDNHTKYDSYAAIDVPNVIADDKTDLDAFITVSDQSKLLFTLNTGGSSPSSITLMPYFDLHHERYTIYWMLYGTDEDPDSNEFTKALDAVTTDTVYPALQQSEIEHSYAVNNSYSGYFETVSKNWRDARGADGYISYTMQVNPDAEKNYLMALYWGSDAPFKADGVSYTRDFKIYADGTEIASQVLDNNSAGNLIYVYYEIPSEIIENATADDEGNKTVTVKFAPSGANTAAGGVFEVRTTTAEVQPSDYE